MVAIVHSTLFVRCGRRLLAGTVTISPRNSNTARAALGESRRRESTSCLTKRGRSRAHPRRADRQLPLRPSRLEDVKASCLFVDDPAVPGGGESTGKSVGEVCVICSIAY